MKASFPEKSKPFEESIREIAEIIINTAKDKIAFVILFGSFARGTWVFDRYSEGNTVYEYASDYDFLIIKKAKKKDGENGISDFDLERKISKEIEARSFARQRHNPHFVIEPIDYVNSELEKGRYFFSDIKKEGILLYDSGEFQLAESKVLSEKEVKDVIKSHFCDRIAEESKTLLEQWKEEKIYPYVTDPINSVQEAEQKVFDIVAVKINDLLPEFSKSPMKQKAFQMRLLRQAIETSPDELQIILREVLGLPKNKQEELAILLRETSLSSIISASKMIADRLKFITGLECLLFGEDFKKHFKERSQLHKMIADNNTWIFGEEFNLSVSDQGLTEVLKKHLKAIGAENIVVDEPVTRIDGKKGIVDLMLTKKISKSEKEIEHLIVELKAPTVIIGSKEIHQIKTYATAVATDERFRNLDTKWSFWLISNELDEMAKRETSQAGRAQGIVYQDQDGKITIWIKSWAEILQTNKFRLKFIQEHLGHKIENGDAVKHLQQTYEQLIKDTKLDKAINRTSY